MGPYVNNNNYFSLWKTLSSFIFFIIKIHFILDQKRSCNKPFDIGPQGGYATNFGAGINSGGRGVEGQVMKNIFKTLITRLVKSNKDLKLPENMVGLLLLMLLVYLYKYFS